MNDCPYPISGPAQPLVDATGGPLLQATNCQWVTVSGAQPLVSATVGPSPKQPTISEWQWKVLLSHWYMPQWAPPLGNQLPMSDS